MPTTDQTQALHARYEALTGLSLPWSMRWHFAWEQWLVHGYTEVDLELVVAYIKRGIKARRRYPGALRFKNLIENYDNFAEELGMARADARARKAQGDPNRAAVLGQTGRKADTGRPARTAADVMAGEEFKKMVDFGKSL